MQHSHNQGEDLKKKATEESINQSINQSGIID